jgi:AcrR family transcriptional regulator
MEYTDKQLQIMTIAERLFSELGFEGASVRDIAKEAEVNVAMISYYFGSKDKLLEAIFIKHTDTIRLKLENILMDEKMEPLQRVMVMIDAYVEKAFRSQGFHRIMVREQMLNKGSHISKLLHEMKKRNQQLVKQLITLGQKEGVFKKNIDIPLMMATMVGTTYQLITTQHFYREINGYQDMPEDEFQKLLRKKLTIHLKTLFKAILTYEE